MWRRDITPTGNRKMLSVVTHRKGMVRDRQRARERERKREDEMKRKRDEKALCEMRGRHI